MEELLHQILSEIKDVKSGQLRLETRMDKLETRMESMEVRMDKLETRMGNMESKVDNLTTEMRSNFKYSNDKMDEHKSIHR